MRKLLIFIGVSLVVLAGQTTITRNQMRVDTVLNVSEAVTNVATATQTFPTGGPCSYSIVARNGLIQTVTNDYTVSTDGLTVTFVPGQVISLGDTIKVICFH